MAQPTVIVHPSAELVAAATAARLLTAMVDAQAARGIATMVLTGGRTGISVLDQVNKLAARDAVRWDRVEFFWGDERFLPEGHAERNETQARQALLDHIPIDPSRVHAMPPSDGVFGDDPEAAAAHYREVVAQVLGSPESVFDVCLLGVGEEGHIASLFPESPGIRDTQHSVVAVRNCPKPPPTRVSLTLAAIQRSRAVWLITTGAGKAEAVGQALAGAEPVDIPAAGARGREATLWLIDTAAAAALPAQ